MTFWDFFPFNIISLKTIQIVVIRGHFSLLLSNISYYRCITVCLTIHLLRDILVVSSLGLLQIKLLWKTNIGFCVHIRFHFSGVNAQKYNCWIMWYLFSFRETAKLFSRMVIQLYIPTRNVWEIQFFCILSRIRY